MDWKVKDYKAVDGSGAVAGRFILQINDLQIRGWTTFHGDNCSEWVSGPQREYTKDGEKKYFSFCYIDDKDSWQRFQKWCLSEIAKMQPATAEPVQESDDQSF